MLKTYCRTFSQKLVQCRMVAQGATVAVLIASAGLSRVSFEDDEVPAERRPEEQWRQMVSTSLLGKSDQADPLFPRSRHLSRKRLHLARCIRPIRTSSRQTYDEVLFASPLTHIGRTKCRPPRPVCIPA